LIPWPFTFQSELNPNQLIQHLLVQIGRYESLEGSEASLDMKSFLVKRAAKYHYPANARLKFNYFLFGRAITCSTGTKISGWVLPSWGALFFTLLIMLASARYIAAVITDSKMRGDWLAVALTAGLPLLLIVMSYSDISSAIKFLKRLIDSDQNPV
jgi:hypothetical protein